MKTIPVCLILVLCFMVLAAAAKNIPIPDWYLNRSLQTRENELIGYGSDRSPEKARAIARKEIALQIEVQVRSEGRFTLSEINGVVDETAELMISEQVNINLESVYIIKEKEHKRSTTARWDMTIRPSSTGLPSCWQQQTYRGKHTTTTCGKHHL